jgi:hypothetical protein
MADVGESHTAWAVVDHGGSFAVASDFSRAHGGRRR